MERNAGKNRINLAQTKASVEFLWGYSIIHGREHASSAKELFSFLSDATAPVGKGLLIHEVS